MSGLFLCLLSKSPKPLKFVNSKMKIFSTFLFFLFLTSALCGQKRFEFTPEMKEAHNLVMSLRFGEAKPLIAKIKQNDPENLMIYHVENYLDFFTCYINENKSEFNKLEKNKDLRLSRIDGGDKNSPYYLYLKANMRLQWALARIKFEEYLTAFLEINKAFKLLKENERKFPEFVPNKKDLGILRAAASTIPGNFKWLADNFTSLEGDLERGRNEIEFVMNYSKENDFIYAQETRVLYSFLLLTLENDGEEAWAILNSPDIDPTQNPLAAFTLANVAMRTGRNDDAIKILENRPKGSKFFPFYFLDFLLGDTKLRRLDKDADGHFLEYLKNFKGKYYIKEAYQKLSWHALINHNFSKFYTYNEKVKSNGTTVAGGDKNADRDAREGVVHNIYLLRARLLFDGGYYAKAEKILADKTPENFKNKREKLEFTYRNGRILHKLGKSAAAISSYQKTIDIGSNEPYYFACNAALQTGLIYEELKNISLAKVFLKKCLNISPSEHKTSLHQQAKAGLARLK